MSGSSNKPESLIGGILKFTGLSAIAGLLAVAVLAPSAAIASTFATAGISIFDGLPAYIKPVNASQSSTIFANRDGQPEQIATFFHENRVSINFEDMSPNILNAVIATEDPRFFEHGGVDIISLIRATLTNVAAGGDGPGASTITMQYVKNSLVETANLNGDEAAIEAATEVTVDRKLREIRYAIALEQEAGKEEILAGYLNLAFFGGRVSGIEAAANYYFGIKASELDVPQAALLAAMLKSPNDYRPDIEENLDRATNRRNYVISKMAEEGYLTAAEAAAAKEAPIVTNITDTPSGCEARQETAYFCDFVVWTIRNSKEFGPTAADREMLLRRGGLQIYTTLDLNLQASAHKSVMKFVPFDDPSRIGTSAVSVEVGTGRVIAMAQNRVFDQTDSGKRGHTSVNYSTDKEFGGSSGFQTGSTYKVFTLAEWLTKGYRLNDMVDARRKDWDTGTEFRAACGGVGGPWNPKNSAGRGSKEDNMTALRATYLSVNTAFANMASQLDLCDIRDTAMRFGVHRADGGELSYVPSSILGVNEVAPLSMAAAMAGIANDGVFCSPVAIDKVVSRRDNSELKIPTTTCSPAVTPDVARTMTYAMERVMTGGTGSASNPADSVPVAGKTGTTDSGVHTWVTGFSSKVATAVWVGNVVGTKSLWRQSLDGRQGSTVRHNIWRAIMTTANKLYGGERFKDSSTNMISAITVDVPDLAGQDPASAEEFLKTADLAAEVEVAEVASLLPAGTVAFTVPAAGETVPRGTIVQVYISAGSGLVVPSVFGLSVQDAMNLLMSAGFAAVSEPQPSQGQFFVNSDSVPAGNVVGTDPPAGSLADAFGAILLIISKGP